MVSLNELEAIDKIKTKMLKYIMYKKRTEKEVRQKFSDIDSEILDNLVEELKENGYINDLVYIERAVNEYINLKNLSIREMAYKLQAKGINKDLLENYISNNMDKLIEYEEDSAQKIYNKKVNTLNEMEIKQYLIKKGYKEEIIRKLAKN